MISRYIQTQKLQHPKDIAVKLIKGSLRSFERFTLTLNEQIDHIEDTIFIKSRKANMLQELYFLKRQSNIGRKLLLLTREVLTGMQGHHKATADLQDAFDLHNKVAKIADVPIEKIGTVHNTTKQDALVALSQLGLDKTKTEKMLDKILLTNGDLPLEELIKQVLKQI